MPQVDLHIDSAPHRGFVLWRSGRCLYSSLVYQDDTCARDEYLVRIEDGWYESYYRDGRRYIPPEIGFGGREVPVPYDPGEDIVAFVRGNFEEAPPNDWSQGPCARRSALAAWIRKRFEALK